LKKFKQAASAMLALTDKQIAERLKRGALTEIM
jgi:hypothetical protein